MWCRSKEVDHECSLLGQGVDHQMGLIEEQRGAAGPVRAGPGNRHSEGIETGCPGGSNKKPADHLHIPEVLGGNSAQLSRQS